MVFPLSANRAARINSLETSGRTIFRQAWGRQVAYGSQFQSWPGRASLAARGIRYRLGGPDYADSSGELPPRPKGMHWRTYEREIARIETFENACNFYLLRCISGLL